jgi:hypothetical protein
MAITLLKSVNFGPGQAGLGTVGFTLINSSGNVAVARSTTGVHEVGANTGIYAAPITFDDFVGSILWDTGGGSPVYATEEYNAVEESVEFIKDIEGGRWSISSAENRMVFYKADNTTVVATFDLRNEEGVGSVEEVFTRRRV